MSRDVVLIGGGGHAAVVHEAAQAAGWIVRGVFDDNDRSLDLPGAPARLGPLPASASCTHPWILALGDLALRHALASSLDPAGAAPPLIHPSAVVSPSVEFGPGVFVGPGAVVNAMSRVGAHAILNSACVVEHHARVGPNTHVAPGAALGGRVTLGKDVLVGLGARVLPGRTVGDRAVVGAGAVVVDHVPDGVACAGCPARQIRRNESVAQPGPRAR